jgi:hypothetical protein
MRLSLIAMGGLTAVLWSGCGPRPAPGAPRPIFRWMRVGSGVVTLGEPLSTAVAAASPGDTLVALPRGSFGGAERITVHLAPDRMVRGLTFDYVGGADFAEMVAGYEAELGPAARTAETRRGEVPAEVATWRDERTELRIVRDPNRSAWTVRATLRDLSRR